MALLDNHLEQISLSAAAIAELPFPPPKRFTNALLRSHDITALIRDTEAHERALFRFAPPEPSNLPVRRGILRKSVPYGFQENSEQSSSGSQLSRSTSRYPAVRPLPGTEVGDQLRHDSAQAGKERVEVDVNLLLKSAESLSGIYPIPGAKEKINMLQSRFNQLTTSIARYESRVSKQTAQLSKLTRREESNEYGHAPSPENGSVPNHTIAKLDEMPVTLEDLGKEEQDVRDLERKKQALEERVSGMERDLGGLLR
ncbi:MAG: hypothetical protein Q9170_001429 [Blastenia crenularia]